MARSCGARLVWSKAAEQVGITMSRKARTDLGQFVHSKRHWATRSMVLDYWQFVALVLNRYGCRGQDPFPIIDGWKNSLAGWADASFRCLFSLGAHSGYVAAFFEMRINFASFSVYVFTTARLDYAEYCVMMITVYA